MSTRLYTKILICLSIALVYSAGSLQAALVIGSTQANGAGVSTLNNGLVGYWSMNNQDMNWKTGKVFDKSGNANDGNVVAMSTSTAPVKGKLGQALSFNGSTQYVGFTTDLEGTGTITACAWFYPKVTAGIIMGNVQFQIALIGSGQIRTTSNNATNIIASASNAYAVNKWNHVCAVRKSLGTATTSTIYANGAVSGTPDQSTPTVTSAFKSAIGTRGSAGGAAFFFNGMIDDVRIYNRALSAAEIHALYLQGQTVLESSVPGGRVGALTTASSTSVAGLAGYWTMNSQDINWKTGKVKDMSGNGFDASLVGMSTTTSPIVGKLGQALKLVGTGSLGAIGPYPLATSSGITLSAWINPSIISGNQIIISYGYQAGSPIQGFQLLVDGIGRLRAFMNAGSMTAATGGIVTNKWQMVTATWDGTNGTLYTNGTRSTNPTAGLVTLKSVTTSIGSGSGGAVFKGGIDDVRIYTRALSAAEIRKLYLQGQTVLESTVSSGRAGSTNTSSSTTGSGLVGYWTFNNQDMNWKTGKVLDKSGQSNDAQLVNMSTSTSPVMGKVGQAVRFKTSTDYINAGSAASLDNIANQGGGGMTVAFWVNPRSNADGTLMTKGPSVNNNGNWQIVKMSASNPARLRFIKEGATDANATYNSLLNSNTWQFIVLTWNGSMTMSTGVTVYKNGALVSQSSAADGATANSDAAQNLTIGSDGLGNSVDASMDDLRIYNRILTASEIKQLYNSGR